MSDQEDAIPGDRAEPASAMSQETENTAGDTAGTTSPVPLVCGNCRAPLTDAFCASCGQAATRSRQLDVRQLFGDFVEKVLNLESSLLRTVVGLTLRPGFVCREYVSGKRTLYTNPVTYLMLYAFLYAFAANVIAGFIGLETELDDRLVEEWGGPLTLLMCVPLTLSAAMSFRRPGHTLAETYVLVLYAFTHASLLTLPVSTMAAPLIDTDFAEQSEYADTFYLTAASSMPLLTMMFIVLYFVWAGKQYYDTTWMMSVWKWSLVFARIMLPCVMSYVFILIVAKLFPLIESFQYLIGESLWPLAGTLWMLACSRWPRLLKWVTRFSAGLLIVISSLVVVAAYTEGEASVDHGANAIGLYVFILFGSILLFITPGETQQSVSTAELPGAAEDGSVDVLAAAATGASPQNGFPSTGQKRVPRTWSAVARKVVKSVAQVLVLIVGAVCAFGLFSEHAVKDGRVILFDGIRVWVVRKQAEQGDAAAQRTLGVFYDEARGVPEDDAEAVKWYRMAASQGDAEAQHYLGFMYDHGLGVPENDVEAVKWYRMAATQGVAAPQFLMGVMYANGLGVPQDHGEAVKWMRKAAGQGHAAAQRTLGVFYDEARGVPEDDVEAVKWYRMAASQGDARAQYYLGIMYDNGLGVPEDDAEAVKWYRLSGLSSEHPRQGNEPGTPADGPVGALSPLMNSIGMQFVSVPAGTFTMGDADGDDDETPHSVTLTKGFELGACEVTQQQYEQLTGSNPSDVKGSQNPVEYVTWNDAVEFCRKLSELPAEQAKGHVYRLPTEAEWEYACRAGTTTRYSFGDNESRLGEYAWHDRNSDGKTHPVGQKKPNLWGLYDMHGNVREWCQDRYGDYSSDSVTDPTGAVSGSMRVPRGGSWGSHTDFCRSAYRCRSASHRRGTTNYRSSLLGFRVVRSSTVSNPPEDRPQFVQVVVAGDRYGIQTADGRYKVVPITDVIDAAVKATGNEDGVKVRILRKASARVSAWSTLVDKLEDAGISPDAILIPRKLVD